MDSGLVPGDAPTGAGATSGAPAAPAEPEPMRPPYKIHIRNVPWDLDERVVEQFFDGLQVC